VRELAERTGIGVLGIGIECREAEKTYDDHIVVPRVSELPARMGDLLRTMLIDD
jgi:hypothetical protein